MSEKSKEKWWKNYCKWKRKVEKENVNKKDIEKKSTQQEGLPHTILTQQEKEPAHSCSSTTEHTLSFTLTCAPAYPAHPFFFPLPHPSLFLSPSSDSEHGAPSGKGSGVGGLGLGFLRDVGCSRHWWVLSRAVGNRSGSVTTPKPEENARTASSGSATSEGSPPAISPWPSSRPTRSSRTRARSSPGPSAPSSESMTATAAPIVRVMFVITCSVISKVSDSITPPPLSLSVALFLYSFTSIIDREFELFLVISAFREFIFAFKSSCAFRSSQESRTVERCVLVLVLCWSYVSLSASLFFFLIFLSVYVESWWLLCV